IIYRPALSGVAWTAYIITDPALVTAAPAGRTYWFGCKGMWRIPGTPWKCAMRPAAIASRQPRQLPLTEQYRGRAVAWEWLPAARSGSFDGFRAWCRSAPQFPTAGWPGTWATGNSRGIYRIRAAMGSISAGARGGTRGHLSI